MFYWVLLIYLFGMKLSKYTIQSVDKVLTENIQLLLNEMWLIFLSVITFLLYLQEF